MLHSTGVVSTKCWLVMEKICRGTLLYKLVAKKMFDAIPRADNIAKKNDRMIHLLLAPLCDADAVVTRTQLTPLSIIGPLAQSQTRDSNCKNFTSNRFTNQRFHCDVQINEAIQRIDRTACLNSVELAPPAP